MKRTLNSSKESLQELEKKIYIYKEMDLNSEEICELISKKKVYVCSELNCQKAYATKFALHYHMLAHKGIKNYVCPFSTCKKKYLIRSSLNRHLRNSKAHCY